MSEIPQELVDLFADEAASRLNRLAEELLRLEERADPAVLDSVFRDAHTLKGSAGMMGFRSFSQVAHRMEDVLHGVRAGTRPMTAPLVDALLAAVDGLRAQLAAVVAGRADDDALAQVEQRLADAVAGAPAVDGASPSTPTADDGIPPADGPAVDDSFARVPLGRIDAMVRLSAEAAVVHTRMVAALHERVGPGALLPPEVYELGAMVRDLEARTTAARTLPMATVLEPLRRAVRDIARAQGKAVRVEVQGEDVELDRVLIDRLGDALLHLVRNAVDHGVEPPVERVQAGKKAQAVVCIAARQRGRDVVLTVADDGRGIDLDRIRRAVGDDELSDPDAVERLFEAGFSTAAAVTDVSGRGVGLDVVRTVLAPVRGRVDVRTDKGKGATFTLTVPLTIASVPSILVRSDGHMYALPLSSVAGTRAPVHTDVPIGHVLGVPVLRPTATVVVHDHDRTAALSVDEVLPPRDVVVKSVGALPGVQVVGGAAIDNDGTVLVVLDAGGLIDAAESCEPSAAEAAVEGDEGAPPSGTPRVLVVDDAAVIREMQQTMLTRAGYEVRVAADGAEALAMLRQWPADLALVDIEMPVMDGLTMTRELRADPALRGTAVVILTSLGSDEDRRRGMEAGADGYIVKGSMSAANLLEAVARLLGREP